VSTAFRLDDWIRGRWGCHPTHQPTKSIVDSSNNYLDEGQRKDSQKASQTSAMIYVSISPFLFSTLLAAGTVLF
jgi:hypothetical protein